MERGLQVLDLRLLVRDLLVEAVGQLLVAHRPLERRAGEAVVLLLDRELRLAHPLPLLLLVLRRLPLQQVLIGDRDRHLGLDLQELVSHVQDDLLDHLLGILGLVDQVVQVGPDESGNSFQ